MKKYFLILSGHLSLSLGIAGIFLPVLPTTPFLLLSAACYVKSSEKLYNWLINHKLLGIYIKQYIKYKAVTVKTKTVSIALLWTVLGATVIFFIDINWLKLLLLCIAIAVTIHILHLKTFKTSGEDRL